MTEPDRLAGERAIAADQSASPTSADFFQGDVRHGLERIRVRLLDLTNRNRLLNFKHTKKSSLRVVDELPDHLFEKLRDGDRMWFRPVPRPRPNEPHAWLAAVGKQGLPVPAANYAQTLGIPTSFELPAARSSAEQERRHLDREIQTLHYAEELEAILRTISAAARLAIEETGSNMLYLALGFLEWYETDESPDGRLAPLVLLPVSIERDVPDQRTFTYRYAITHSGEDIVANISLQEKMRADFGLAIPDLREEELPESYFARVERTVTNRGSWKVRREATLCMLSFGKLLMYRDLDPKNWPNGRSPAEHPRIREFFEGIQHTDVPVAPDYPIDSPDLAGQVPPVIDDADSSQHSALIDAMAGRNLVIQGPPGTGKSQTITNLIAAAIEAGKSVLFVSEKLAALEVVHHRLNKAGLGIFCLELHSHRTHKRSLLDDIRVRVESRGRFRQPQALDEMRLHLESLRERLTQYAEVINTGFGRLGHTIYDVLWWCERCKTDLAVPAERLERLTLDKVRSLTRRGLEERRQLLRTYGSHVQAARAPTGNLADHPWHGIQACGRLPAEQRVAIATLEEYRSSTSQLVAWCEEIRSRSGYEMGKARLAVEEFAQSVSSLPDCPAGALVDLLPALNTISNRQALKIFGERIAEYHRVRHEVQLELSHGTVWSLTQAEESETAAETLRALLRSGNTLKAARAALGNLADATTALHRARASVDDLNKALERSLPYNGECAPVVHSALLLAERVPPSELYLRHPGLDAENATKVLEAATREAEVALSIRKQLLPRLRIELAPGESELIAHARAASDDRWWRFLAREYRAARRLHRSLWRGSHRPRSADAKADLQALVDYLVQVRRVAANVEYRQLSGNAFAGVDTPFRSLCTIAEWRAAIRRSLETRASAGETAANALWSAPAHRLEALQIRLIADPMIVSNLAAGLESLNQAELLLCSEHLAEKDEELTEFADRLVIAVKRASSAVETLCRNGISDEYVLESVKGLAEQVRLLHRLEQAILSDTDVQHLLGDHYAGCETGYGPISLTLAFFDQVTASSVPITVKNWVIDPEAPARVVSLKDLAAGGLEMLAKIALRAERFREATQLNDDEWWTGRGPTEREFLDSILERADKALDAPQRLPEWLDYLEARRAAVAGKLGPLVDIADAKAVPPDAIVPMLDFVVANSLVKAVFDAHPEMAHFSGLSHEGIRKEFARLDSELIQLTRARVAAVVDRRTVPVGRSTGPVGGYTDLSLLDHELSKQRRHVPIRQLVRRAGSALQALKPCFMMGPLSVAQYLGAGELSFDIVVMDEASQLKPEDALGAIARAAQVVVVGDPMQLPPTSFFDRVDGDDGTDDESVDAIEEAESILDVARHLYRPTRILRWHYRSRHASLIAFSNREFYDRQLVVFPSPIVQHPEYGIKFIHVRNAVYEDRKNWAEAQRVVESAIDHMHAYHDDSLAIVTLNTVQRDIIANELEQRLKSNPIAREFVRRHDAGLEPVLIKNLENIQGDERDAVYVSVTYGPNTQGRVFQRFGPINGATGHRRLNVLFTRARRRLVLFSSMVPDDIIVDPASSAWGVRALRSYLQYAQTGILDEATFSGREPESDFEVAVAEALARRGIRVQAQIGVAGFFIDLAVSHPRNPNRFVLGIECDGAAYHSSRSARDRDRLRQSILEDLGWKILRIWSADWFKAPEVQIDRVVRAVEEQLESEAEDEGVEVVANLFAVSDDKAPPLTVAQAHDELIALRESIMAAAPTGAKTVLSDQMIGALLRYRPVSHEEWQRKIPFDLRFDASGEEMEHLPAILAIVRRIAVSRSAPGGPP